MDNTGPPGKRTRLDDNAYVLTTSSEPRIQSNVDAMTNLWRSEYDRKSHEKMVLDIKHMELQTKYTDLESRHSQLQQAYQNLLVLYNSQSEHISQLPNQDVITCLKQTIKVMEAENQRNLKMICDVEKQRDAYEAIITDFAKKEKETNVAFEKEKKVIKNMFDRRLKTMKKTYEKESARFRQKSDGLNAKEKNHIPMIKRKENVRNEADLTVLLEEGRSLRLRDQTLPWIEYEKHVSTGILKSLQLVRVRVEKPNGNMASLEEILEKLPNIQNFGFVTGRDGSTSTTSRKSFTNLLLLQPFKDLQKFYLSGVTINKFDPDSFLDFMKYHPKCQFLISFHLTNKRKFNVIAKKLRNVYPSTDKLVIDLLQPNNSVIHR